MKPALNFKKLLFLVLVMLGMVFQFACTDSNLQSEYDFHEISADFKSYTAFDSSSFWVYEKTTSSVDNIDTVFVTKVTYDRRFHIDVTTTGYFYDAIELSLKSSFIGLTKAETSAGEPYQNSQMNENYRVYFLDGTYYSIFTPKFPLDSVQLLGEAEGNYTNLGFYPEISISGTTYQEVYHTQVIKNEGLAEEFVMEFYFARNFGLVKYIKKQPYNGVQIVDEWVLKDSRLIPISK